MPVDNRRLPVPEETKSPYRFNKNSAVSEEDDSKRPDDRKWDEVRPIFLKTGVVSQAKGSAYMELNKTKVICAVYGPREVTRREEFSMKGQLYCEFKYATFSCRVRRDHQRDAEEKEYSTILRQALEPAVLLDKFPKARMDVFVTVLENDGGALSAAMTCASLALSDANIEMYDLVIGCTMAQRHDNVLIDPCAAETSSPDSEHLDEGCGVVTIGYMPSIHQVSALTEHGDLPLDAAIDSMKLCIDACKQINPVVQQTLRRAVKARLHKNMH